MFTPERVVWDSKNSWLTNLSENLDSYKRLAIDPWFRSGSKIWVSSDRRYWYELLKENVDKAIVLEQIAAQSLHSKSAKKAARKQLKLVIELIEQASSKIAATGRDGNKSFLHEIVTKAHGAEKPQFDKSQPAKDPLVMFIERTGTERKLRDQNETLSRKNQELEQTVSHSQLYIAELRSQLKELHEIVQDSQHKLDESTQQQATTAQTLRTLRAQAAQLEQENTSLKRSASVETADKLRGQLQALEKASAAEKDKYEQTLQGLRSKIDELTRQIVELTHELATQESKAIAILQDKLRLAEHTLKGFQDITSDDIVRLQTDLAEARKRAVAARDAQLKAERQTTVLREKVRGLEQQAAVVDETSAQPLVELIITSEHLALLDQIKADDAARVQREETLKQDLENVRLRAEETLESKAQQATMVPLRKATKTIAIIEELNPLTAIATKLYTGITIFLRMLGLFQKFQGQLNIDDTMEAQAEKLNLLTLDEMIRTLTTRIDQLLSTEKRYHALLAAQAKAPTVSQTGAASTDVTASASAAAASSTAIASPEARSELTSTKAGDSDTNSSKSQTSQSSLLSAFSSLIGNRGKPNPSATTVVGAGIGQASKLIV